MGFPNFAGLTRAFVYSTQIAQEFIRAKQEQSEGGSEVTPSEMALLAAKVACCWAQADGAATRLKLDELVKSFEDAGWKILKDEAQVGTQVGPEQEDVNNG